MSASTSSALARWIASSVLSAGPARVAAASTIAGGTDEPALGHQLCGSANGETWLLRANDRRTADLDECKPACDRRRVASRQEALQPTAGLGLGRRLRTRGRRECRALEVERPLRLGDQPGPEQAIEPVLGKRREEGDRRAVASHRDRLAGTARRMAAVSPSRSSRMPIRSIPATRWHAGGERTCALAPRCDRQTGGPGAHTMWTASSDRIPGGSRCPAARAALAHRAR